MSRPPFALDVLAISIRASGRSGNPLASMLYPSTSPVWWPPRHAGTCTLLVAVWLALLANCSLTPELPFTAGPLEPSFLQFSKEKRLAFRRLDR